MNKEELKSTILSEYEKGNVVVANADGLAVFNLADFIKQPTQGLLYDLNRLPEVVFTFLDDPKWVNDYAVAMVISTLKNKIESQEKEKAAIKSVEENSNKLQQLKTDITAIADDMVSRCTDGMSTGYIKMYANKLRQLSTV